MKISIIGAGNVGGLTAMRICEAGWAEVCLIDIAQGFAQGKAFDLDDARWTFKSGYSVSGSNDMKAVEGSEIVVVTAGFSRRPGMTREELLNKNAAVLKGVCADIRSLAPSATVVVVTNPLDLMTRFALEITGFSHRKVMPLPRLTKVKGVALPELLPDAKVAELVAKTVGRGLEIVTLLGSGSAYFAPSAAVFQLVRAIAKDEKRILGVSASLGGEYGISGVSLGVPCRIGKNGIEDIVVLDLEPQEKQKLIEAASRLKEQRREITVR